MPPCDRRLAVLDGVRRDKPPPDRPRERARNHARDVPHCLCGERARRLRLPVVPAGLQETVPFPPEVQRRDSLQRHLQKLLGEIARLLAIPLYRLRSELFLRVLLEELFQERPEGLR